MLCSPTSTPSTWPASAASVKRLAGRPVRLARFFVVTAVHGPSPLDQIAEDGVHRGTCEPTRCHHVGHGADVGGPDVAQHQVGVGATSSSHGCPSVLCLGLGHSGMESQISPRAKYKHKTFSGTVLVRRPVRALCSKRLRCDLRHQLIRVRETTRYGSDCAATVSTTCCVSGYGSGCERDYRRLRRRLVQRGDSGDQPLRQRRPTPGSTTGRSSPATRRPRGGTRSWAT
jgi:hypothetical protein